ncbi:MAG TPA: helix-turn-helix domain-containing protein [Ktedonobacterales bacterium]|nr:helix-turn-helix domain-containing protein [Ktedonobacterales bacterium]
MVIARLREALEEILMHAQGGNLDEVVQSTRHALHELENDHLVTTTQAAELLGIGSVNTMKALVRKLALSHEMHGNRMMIPISELERIQQTQVVRELQASDRVHQQTEGLGSDAGMSPDQLEELSRARPGRLPWARAPRTDEHATAR